MLRYCDYENIQSGSMIGAARSIAENLWSKLSDHLAKFLIIPEECHRPNKKQDFYTRDLKNFDRENFFLDLLDINWQENISLSHSNLNIALEGLLGEVDDIVNSYLPKRKMTFKEIKAKQKPWVSNDIIKLIKNRDTIYKHYVKTKNETTRDLYLQKYKNLRNQIVSLCKQSKKQYYQDFFSKNSDNLRNTWRGIKSIINLDKKGKSPTSLLVNDELITDPTMVANEFL